LGDERSREIATPAVAAFLARGWFNLDIGGSTGRKDEDEEDS
jgi:hypothetical protein